MPGTNRHPIFARVYPRISRTAELAGAAEHRRKLLAGLTGQVVEVGAGHGLNFSYYPATVTRVVAIEPEPYLRDRARDAARRAAVQIDVTDGTAEALPADDGEFDAAVSSLVLCSVRDQRAALQEINRVLHLGGQLRFYEHVISLSPGWARFQRALDATIYPPLFGGCHCARDTGAVIRQMGFEVEHEERFPLKASPLVPAIPHILGIARRV
jgi:ubiquinone/menaquinone biosynthesis C-methylase UbiE